MNNIYLKLFAITLIYSCKSSTLNTDKPTIPAVTSTDNTIQEYCFIKAENKDTTILNLRIIGKSVEGTMEWMPWKQSGTTGKVSGIKNNTEELELIYSYNIEGSNQSETKIMKMQGENLLIKKGELIDPNNSGNLKYKDVSAAVYSEILKKVSCK